MPGELLKTDKLPDYRAPKVKKLSKLEGMIMESRIKKEKKEKLNQKEKPVKIREGVLKRKGASPADIKVMGAKIPGADKAEIEVVIRRPSGLTGREFEVAMAGSVDIYSKRYRADYQQILEEELRTREYSDEQIKKEMRQFQDIMLWDIGEQAATLLVKKNQPADPVNPRAPFGRAIRQALIRELGILDPKKQEKIKFYTAVSKNKISLKEAGYVMEEMLKTMTVLDAYYKTDCFIEIGGDKEGESIHSIGYTIPFDLTVNRDKRNPKAIIVEDIALPEERETQETFDKYARQLARQAILQIPESTKKYLAA